MKIVVQKIPFVDAQTNDVYTRKNINNPFLKNMKRFHNQVQDTRHYEIYTPSLSRSLRTPWGNNKPRKNPGFNILASIVILFKWSIGFGSRCFS